MKIKNKILLLTIIGLSINHATKTKNLNPTFGSHVPTNEFPSGFNKNHSKKSIILSLRNILEQDNVKKLKKFIKENPTFQWNEKYVNLPWKKESQTPLSAATWFGAINCLKYLLMHNTGNIKTSYGIVSSHGFSVFHYANNPPKLFGFFPNERSEKFKKIAILLEKNMPKNTNFKNDR